MSVNKSSTRYVSSIQEKRIAKKLGGYVNANSGAGKFNKADVVVPSASMSIECKTCLTEKNSFSIKKEWFEKHEKEAFQNRLSNHCIAFNFCFDDNIDYYVINDRLMKYLIEKLSEENL